MTDWIRVCSFLRWFSLALLAFMFIRIVTTQSRENAADLAVRYVWMIFGFSKDLCLQMNHDLPDSCVPTSGRVIRNFCCDFGFDAVNFH